MIRRQPYLGIGYLLAALVMAAGAFGVVMLLREQPAPSQQGLAAAPWLLLAIMYGVLLLGTALHEFGHILAAWLLGQKVSEVRIGSPPSTLKFGIGGIRWHLGLVPHGVVRYGSGDEATRRAAVIAAGPLVNLLTAAVTLAMPIHAPVRYSAAWIFAVQGVSNLLPWRSRTGRMSDGGQLLRMPARSRAEKDVAILLAQPDWLSKPEAADLLLRGCRLEVWSALGRLPALASLLGNAGRTKDLLWVHQLRLPWLRSQQHYTPQQAQQYALATNAIEWQVAMIPGLPLAEANLAGRRLQWALKHVQPDQRPAVQHTLAVVRLRQGFAADVESLCAEALKTELTPSQRASVLATVAMARHRAGGAAREAMAESLTLDREAELVGEAVALLARPQDGQHASQASRS